MIAPRLPAARQRCRDDEFCGEPRRRPIKCAALLALSMLAAGLAAACDSPVTAPPPAKAAPGARAAAAPGDPLAAEEKAALTFAKDASRRGASLTLAYGQHRSLRFIDRLSCPPGALPCVRHFYVGALGDRPSFHVVERHFPALTDILLVNRTTGGQVATFAIPQPSPDGRYWAVATAPGDHQDAAIIQMWRVGDAPRLVGFYEAPAGAELHLRGWKSARALDIRLETRLADGQRAGWSVSVEPRDNEWAFVDHDPVTGAERVTPMAPRPAGGS